MLLIIGQVTAGIAQETDFCRKGLIRTHLTLSPSKMFSDGSSNFYFHGSLEGFLTSRLSLSGESYYYLGSLSSAQPKFDENHNTFFGANFHWVKNRNDLFLGLHPGFSYTRINADAYQLSQSSLGINPAFSLAGGYNFYLHRFFHFFIHSRLVLANHNHDVPSNLAELRFSAGLGFNIYSLRKDRNP